MEGSDDLELFDETAYLARYPDVAQAVGRKIFPSGQYHYQRHGSREGRIGTKILSVPTVSIDPTKLFKTLKNPPIKTQAPKVFGIEKMRPDFRAMYDILWNQDRPESIVKCFVLENVIVAGDGIVFDNEGNAFSETIHQSSSHDVEQCFQLVGDLLKRGDGDAVPGTSLLCAKAGVKNYGHWLFEMLPIAYLLEEENTKHAVVVPDILQNDAMNAVIEHSLNMIGVDSFRIVKYATPQRFEKLIVVLGLSHHGSFYSPLAIDAFDRMAEQAEGRGAERIWVSRARTARRLAEEHEVCEALKKRGWVIASPEDMSLHEQIALFKDAKVVAGVNGAGLTNIAFSRAGLKIISFVPEQMPDIFFWMLSQFKKQHFFEVRCNQESRGAGEFNWQCRLMLSAAQVLDYIDVSLGEKSVASIQPPTATNATEAKQCAKESSDYPEYGNNTDDRGRTMPADNLPVIQDHYDYLNEVVKNIDGWLNDYPALQTMYLLDLQESRGARGALLEIGIYKGRHLALLLRSSRRSGDPVYAIDTMELVPEAEVRQTIEKTGPTIDCTLIAGSSGAMTASELLSRMQNNRPRFISIDGSHECENVLWDLRLADDLIMSDGLISVDDFMNWTAIGVNEGVHRFFSTQRNVVPIAMSSNKLFLCRAHMATFYRSILEQYADADKTDGHSLRFVERRNAWRGSVESSLWGYKILNFF